MLMMRNFTKHLIYRSKISWSLRSLNPINTIIINNNNDMIISSTLLKPPANPNSNYIIHGSVLAPINNYCKRFSTTITTSDDDDDDYDIQRLLRKFDPKNWNSALYQLESFLEYPAEKMHGSTHHDYVYQSSGRFEFLKRCFDKLKEKLPANDERILRLASTLEPKMKEFETKVKYWENELKVRLVEGVVLGLLLRVQNDQEVMEMNKGYMEDFRIGECRYQGNLSALHLLKEMQDYDEILLVRWMELQVKRLKEHFKDFDSNEYDRLFANSNIQSQHNLLTRNVCNFTNQKQVKVEDGNDKIEEIVLNTLVMIAKARYKLTNAFSHKDYYHRPGLPKAMQTSIVVEAIKQASDSFDRLVAELPENYEINLREWVELNIKPKLQEWPIDKVFKDEVPQHCPLRLVNYYGYDVDSLLKMFDPKEDYFSEILGLEGELQQAAKMKHTDRFYKYVDRSKDAFDYLEDLYDILMDKLPLKTDERILRLPFNLKLKMKELEAKVNYWKNEYDTQCIEATILGLLLRILNDQETIGCFMGDTFIEESRRNGNDFYLQLLEDKDKGEILLVKWMELQIRRLKEHFKELDSNEYNRSFENSSILLHHNVDSRNMCNFMQQRQQINTADKDEKLYETSIINTLSTIAKARYKLTEVLSNMEWDDEDPPNAMQTSIALDAINHASENFDRLMEELPHNYNTTLREWVDLYIKPKLQELSKDKLHKDEEFISDELDTDGDLTGDKDENNIRGEL